MKITVAYYIYEVAIRADFLISEFMTMATKVLRFHFKNAQLLGEGFTVESKGVARSD